MAHILDAVIQLKDNFSDTLKTVEDNVKNFQRTSKNLAKEVWSTGKTLTQVGDNLTKKVSVPLVGAGIAAAKMGMDFNKEMANVATMIPGQTERLYKLKGAVQDVAIEVAKDTGEIAQGTYGVISAYGDAADTMDKVLINAKAATAGLATTDDALNLSSAVMKGFGDTSAEANQKVMDLAFETLRLGQTSFPDMASSIGAVVPLTNELGIAQEELFAVYAAATGVTGNASEVSTQYKGALKALMAPTKDMAGLMKKLGYADGQAMIEKEGLIGAIQTIVNTAKSSNTPLQKYIGSIQGQTIALSLAGELSDEYSRKLEELKDSTGAMDSAFKEQTEGINETGFLFEQSMVRMKVAAQDFGDTIAPIVSNVVDMFSRFTETLRNLTPEQRETIVEFAKKAIVIGPAIGLIGRLTTGVGKVIYKFSDFSKLLKKYGSILGIIKSPMFIIVGAITALVIAGILLYKNWDKVKEKVNEVFPNMKERIVETMEHIKTIFSGVISFIKVTWFFLAPFFTAQWEIIKNVFFAAVAGIGNILSGVIQILSGVIEFIIGIFTLDWARAWEGVKSIFDGIYKGIVAIVETSINSIIGIVNGMIAGLNKIKIPDFVPGIGGKGVNIPLIPKLAKGTDFWKGGIVQVHERGGEIIDLPRGSRVYPHDKSVDMARKRGRREGIKSISIAKLADTIVVREDADIDKIANTIVRKIEKASLNMA